MHCTGQNSGHLPHGKHRLTSMKATSFGRFFFSATSSGQGASGMRSSLSRLLMTSIAADIDPFWTCGYNDSMRGARQDGPCRSDGAPKDEKIEPTAAATF